MHFKLKTYKKNKVIFVGRELYTRVLYRILAEAY